MFSVALTGFMAVSVMCLLSLIKASITNPGRVPLLNEDQNSIGKIYKYF